MKDICRPHQTHPGHGTLPPSPGPSPIGMRVYFKYIQTVIHKQEKKGALAHRTKPQKILSHSTAIIIFQSTHG